MRYYLLPAFTIEPHMKYEVDDLNGGVGGRGTMITKQSKHADRAIQWLDFLAQDDTQKRLLFGVEGVHYDHNMLDGWEVPLRKPEIAKYLADNPPQVHRAKYGLGAMYLFRDKYWGETQGFLTLDDVGKEIYANAFANYTDLAWNRGRRQLPRRFRLCGEDRRHHQGLLQHPDLRDRLRSAGSGAGAARSDQPCGWHVDRLNRWLQLRLEGRTANTAGHRDAYHRHVAHREGMSARVVRVLSGGSNYLGQNEAIALLRVGAGCRSRWPIFTLPLECSGGW